MRSRSLALIALLVVLATGCATTTTTTRYRPPEGDAGAGACIARCARWTQGEARLVCVQDCPHVREDGGCGDRSDCLERATHAVSVDGDAVITGVEIALRLALVLADRGRSQPSRGAHTLAKPAVGPAR